MQKAITPIISVVLLIMLTIVASGGGFLFINNISSNLENNVDGGNVVGSDTSQLNLVSITGTKAIVRNDGNSAVNEVNVFVNGELINYTLDSPINPGEVAEITYDAQTVGEDLEIKILYNNEKIESETSPAAVNTEDSSFVEESTISNEPDESSVYCLADSSSNVWFSGTITGSNGPCCGDDNIESFSNNSFSCVNNSKYNLLLGTYNLSDANVTFKGVSASDYTGLSVSSGDFNGDGIKDVLIGAGQADPYSISNAGKSYIMFGKSNLLGIYNLSNANVTFNGIITNDVSGSTLSSGDFNADSIDDVLIGAYKASPYGKGSAGEAYIVYGNSNLDNEINLTNANVTFKGNLTGDWAGYGISSADINNDNYDDILLGATWADPNGAYSGQAYVIYSQENLASEINLSDSNITVNGVISWDLLGETVKKGDFNGDGYKDVLIGASGASPNDISSAGAAYIFYGGESVTGIFNSTSANVTIQGINADDYLGYGLGSGDFNGDGIDDILVGAYEADPNSVSNAGEAYIIYGNSNLNGEINASNANVTFSGLTSGDNFGWTVESGDFNGDGFYDAVIAAIFANSNAGNVYLFYGNTTLNENYDTSQANIILNGKYAGDDAGWSLSSGDYNNDGIDDVLIGADQASPYSISNAGEIYIMYISNLI